MKKIISIVLMAVLMVSSIPIVVFGQAAAMEPITFTQKKLTENSAVITISTHTMSEENVVKYTLRKADEPEPGLEELADGEAGCIHRHGAINEDIVMSDLTPGTEYILYAAVYDAKNPGAGNMNEPQQFPFATSALKIEEYSVKLQTTEGVELKTGKPAYREGEKVTISYILQPEYVLKEITCTFDGKTENITKDQSFIMPKGDVSIQAKAEKSEIPDINNLADGTYSVQISMKQLGKNSPSMADGAVEKQAILAMKNGVGVIEVTFKPMNVSGLWGSLMSYKIFNAKNPKSAWDDIFAEQSTVKEANYLSYAKVNPDTGEMTPIEGVPEQKPSNKNTTRPTKISFKLPYMGTDEDYNKIYSRVSVDVMSLIEGVGDQEVTMQIDYSTLKPIQINATLDITEKDITMIEGSTFPIQAKVLGAQGYKIRYRSMDDSIATVDERGLITAKQKGVVQVFVYAEKPNMPSLEKVILVKIAGKDEKPIHMENITYKGNALHATLAGEILMKDSQYPEIEISDENITAAVPNQKKISSVEIVLSSKTIKAINRARKNLTIRSSLGEMELDKHIVEILSQKGVDSTLIFGKTGRPKDFVGTYSNYYYTSLKQAGREVHFDNAQVRITVPPVKGTKYAYLVNKNIIKDKKSVVFSDKEMTFKAENLGIWALSAKTYEIGSGQKPKNDGYFLSDGNYYVTIHLWHAQSDKPSMGDAAFRNNRRALVTVKNGKIASVQIASNPVDVGTVHSAVIKMSVAGVPVTKLETGKLVTKPANNTYTYIRRAKFSLPSYAQPEHENEVTFVPVSFVVPDTPMDTIVVGGLSARIKFVWSSVTKTKTSQLRQDEKPVSTVGAIDMTDEKTSISVKADKGVFKEEVRLVVNEITDGEDFDMVKDLFKDSAKKIKLYNIQFVNKKGIEVKPNGIVHLLIPIPQGYTPDKMMLYRIVDGNKVLVQGELDKSGYRASQKEFGLYAFVENEESVKNDPVKPKVSLPENTQGDNSILGWIIGGGVITLGLLTAMIVLTKKSKRK